MQRRGRQVRPSRAMLWTVLSIVLWGSCSYGPVEPQAPEAPIASGPIGGSSPPVASTSEAKTCACASGLAQAEASAAASALSDSRPTIAYNGPTIGDVMPSQVEQRIRDAGAIPLRLTPKNLDALSIAHAVILVGGDDIDPQRYGERAHPTAHLLSPEREQFDFQLIERARALSLPVLGICLGAQELWVAAHGTLIQDIPTEVGKQVNHRAKESTHAVSLIPGTRLAQIYGATALRVFSNHHQAVDVKPMPPQFSVAATSSDGVVEAFETRSSDGAPLLGVGWHPEKDPGEHALFEYLVAEARRVQVSKQHSK